MMQQAVLVMVLSFHPIGGYEESKTGMAYVAVPEPLERCVVWPVSKGAPTPTGVKWYWTWLCATKEGGWLRWDAEPQRV